jgi:hypothetical protein
MHDRLFGSVAARYADSLQTVPAGRAPALRRRGVAGVVARPERLELPTYWFEASRSIHLSYGREILERGAERAAC